MALLGGVGGNRQLADTLDTHGFVSPESLIMFRGHLARAILKPPRGSAKMAENRPCEPRNSIGSFIVQFSPKTRPPNISRRSETPKTQKLKNSFQHLDSLFAIG